MIVSITLQQVDGESSWTEEYNVTSVTNQDEAETWAINLIERFNDRARPGERRRKLLSTIIDVTKRATEKHTWEKTNLVTIVSGSRMYDTARCTICGITAKRYGLGGYTRDDEFYAPCYITCSGAVKALELRKKVRATREKTRVIQARKERAKARRLQKIKTGGGVAMVVTDIFSELVKAAGGIQPNNAESGQSYLSRVCVIVQTAPDEIWNSLSLEAQTWYNDIAIPAMNSDKPVPECPGFVYQKAQEGIGEAAVDPGKKTKKPGFVNALRKVIVDNPDIGYQEGKNKLAELGWETISDNTYYAVRSECQNVIRIVKQAGHWLD